MSFQKKSFIIIVLSILTCACGEVSYKRGASVRDVENAHKACRGVDESAFSECLKKQGWEIQKFDDSGLFAEVSVTDNRGTPPAKNDQSAFVEVQDNDSSHHATSKDKIERKTTPSAESPENSDIGKTPELTPSSKETVVETKTASKPTSAPVDPLKTYKINSWWKFGGTPEHLKRDQNNCIATLGEAHQPDMSTQTYTRGLIECLHKNGWKALKAIK